MAIKPCENKTSSYNFIDVTVFLTMDSKTILRLKPRLLQNTSNTTFSKAHAGNIIEGNFVDKMSIRQ